MRIKGVESKMVEKDIKTLLDNVELSKSEKIRQLFAGGYTVNEIKDIVGVRYNFVYNVVKNFIIVEGIEVEKSRTESKKDLIVELLAEGKTITEVATETRSNYNYVWKINKDYQTEVLSKAVKEVKAEAAKEVQKAEPKVKAVKKEAKKEVKKEVAKK